MNKKATSSNRIIAERLEPRVLFSADPVGLAVGAFLVDDDYYQAPDSTDHDINVKELLADQQATEDSIELIFIDIRADQSREDIQALIEQDNSDALVYIIDSKSGGIESITDIIAQHESVSGIHLVVHGDDGGLRLGNDWLDIESLDNYQSQLSGWKSSLTENADLLIYGCDVTSAPNGLALVDQLANLTGADVAASSDKTGHAKFGGNWELETTTGDIETKSIASEQLQDEWENSLAVINVNTTNDVVNGSDGLTSLREAIIQANSTAEADTIILGAGTYTLTNGSSGNDNANSGDLDVSQHDITIQGAGSGSTTIDGDNNDRIFHVLNGANLTVENLTLQDGEASAEGGAIRVQDNSSSLTLNSVHVLNNQAIGTSGGAIFANGNTNVTINDSYFSGNSAGSKGGAIDMRGSGTLTIVDSEFTNNTSSSSSAGGGAIIVEDSANASISGSYIHGNDASGGNGGGLLMESTGNLNIDATTFAGNSAQDSGGAVQVIEGGNVTISNSTFSGNTSNTGGSAVNVDGSSVTVETSTFTGNNDSGSGGAISSGNGGSVDISSSILVDNPGPDINGSGVSSGGNNLTDENNTGTFDQGSDINNGDADLGPLEGGPPPTHTPGPNSDTNGTGTQIGAVDTSNAAPEAVNDAFTVAEGGTWSSTAGGTNVLASGNASVLTNDTDANSGDTLTAALVSGPSEAATFNLNSDGTFIYVHNGNETPTTDSFTYTVDDGNGGTATGTVNITITATNDAPVASDESLTVDEGGTWSSASGSSVLDNGNSSLIDNDTDADSTTLTVSIKDLPLYASTFNLNNDGTFTYVHNGSDTPTTDTFTYTVSDGNGGTDEGTVTIAISPTNDAPIANNDSISVAEGATWNSQTGGTDTLANGNSSVLGNDTDIENDNLTVTILDQPNNAFSFSLNSDGTFTYVHDGSEPTGNDSFTYTVSDGNGGTDTGTVTINITATNDAPVAPPESFTIDEGGTWSSANGGLSVLANGNSSVLDNDSDIENDTLTASLNTGPSNASSFTLNSDGTFTYVHDGSEPSGNDSFTYTVSDGNGGSDTGTVTIIINQVNDAPVATNEAFTIAEGGTWSSEGTGTDVLANGNSSVLGNDSDPENDTLVATLITGPSQTTAFNLNSDGTFTYVHDGSDTSTDDSFTYQISDGNGGTDIGTVTITNTPTNDAPVATNETFTVDEGGTWTSELGGADLLDNGNASVLNNDTDVENDPLEATIVTGPAHSSSFNLNADGTFTYVHNGNESPATDSFTYTVSDGNGGTDTGTVTIAINPTNDNPVATNEAFTVAEGGTWNSTNTGTDVLANGNASLLDNDSDVDTGDTLTTAELVGPANATTFTLNADGTFIYIHDGSETTTDTFTYTVSDGNGGTDTGTVTINIAATNDAPVATDEAFTVDEAGTWTSAAGGASVLANGNSSLLDNDSDVDAGDVLEAAVLAGPSHASSFNLNADGTFTYVHNGNETPATDSFTYTVSDGNGGTDTGTVTITINPTNDAPVATDEAFTVSEGGTWDSTGTDVLANGNASLLDNDSDADAGDTLQAAIVTGPTQAATFTLNPDGTFVYVHNGSETPTTDSFTYTVDDGNGGTDTGTVSITINATNDAPVAADEFVTIDEGGTWNSAGGTDVLDNGNASVLTNDTDPDTGDTLQATILTGPTQATSFTLNPDGTFSYTHNGNEPSAADTFSYTVSDGNGGTDTATVTIAISQVNDAPVASPDAYTVAEGDTLIGASVLANDVDIDDANNTLTASLVTAPLHAAAGTFVLNADGTFTYEHDSSETNTDTFSYVAQDPFTGESATTVVTITITGVNDSPVLNGLVSDYNLTEREPFTATIPVDQYIDPEGDDWTIALTYLDPDNGEVALPTWLNFDPNTQVLSGTPPVGSPATMTIQMIATDTNGNASIPVQGTLTIADNPIESEVTTSDMPENTLGASVGVLSVGGNPIPATVTVTFSDPRFEFDTATSTVKLIDTESADFETEPTIDLTITLTETAGAMVVGSYSETVTIIVTDNNDTPTVEQSPTDTFVPNGGTLALPANMFADQDAGDTLVISAELANATPTNGTALPNWLAFDSATQTFSIAGTALVDSLQVTISADDQNGGVIQETITLQFTAPVIGPVNPVEPDPEPEPEPEPVDEEEEEETTEEPEEETEDTTTNVSNTTGTADGEGVSVGDIEANYIDISSLIKPLPLISADIAANLTEFLTDLVVQTDNEETNFYDTDYSFNFLTEESISRNLDKLAESFDRQKELMEEAFNESRSAIGRSMTLTSGFSVGYLIWLIRGGTLMGSVLSSMPAWRLVDPLPILGSLGDDFDDEDDSLESMVKNDESEIDEDSKLNRNSP